WAWVDRNLAVWDNPVAYPSRGRSVLLSGLNQAMNATPDRSLLGWFRFLFSRVLFPGQPDVNTGVRRGPFLIVLLLPAAILYPTLGFHLLEPDEGRYAQIPKEMHTHHSWVVPTLQGEPYLDKPPLMYWLVALSYRAFGVSPESARLVPAVCVHLTILAVYLIGRRSLGERAAFWAALLLSVAPGFVCVARLLLLDGLLTLCVTMSVLCGFEAVRTGRLKPAWWIAAAVASGLGFLTKGPISEVLLFVPLWAFGFLTRRDDGGRMKEESETTPNMPPRRASFIVHPLWYVLFFAIVIAVNVPWYVAIYREQPQFLGHFFWQHNVMRFLQPFDHLQPIWFYGPILIAGLLPGTILLVAYLYQLLRGGSEVAATRSLAGGFWLLTGLWCVFFFSCSGSKLPTYILPAYPFLCLAVGEFIARTRWNGAISTRAMIGVMAALVLFLHHYAMPWYAQERSPYGRPELVERFVDNPDTTVLCFPRNCDSLAFYKDRSDMHNIRTRDVNQMFVDCHHRPKTVILFTHYESLEGIRQILPPSLEIVETVTLKRKNGNPILDKLFGSTPWGLCDVAVVVPKNLPTGAE
ncbi:MAG TPA: glycosyltransferase family 39 protein, partial [Gemmata sp.]|nr:glycosyltransferase family 39 protein [Gemmata sp.]